MFEPSGASGASRAGAVAPRPTRTAPPGGIGVPPPCFACTTVPTRSRCGCAAGNGERVELDGLAGAGVVGP